MKLNSIPLSVFLIGMAFVSLLSFCGEANTPTISSSTAELSDSTEMPVTSIMDVLLETTTSEGGDLLVEHDQYNTILDCEFSPTSRISIVRNDLAGGDLSTITFSFPSAGFTGRPGDSTSGGGEIVGRVDVPIVDLSGSVIYRFHR